MLALLSPSKTLDFEDEIKCAENTTPALLSRSKKLIPLLKKLSEKDLQKLMSISPKLASLNHDRYQSFKTTTAPKGSRQALLAFRGDVYEGFPLEEYKAKDFKRAQKTIRILSGLYGLLRPLDLIQPYRLEMKTALKNDAGKDLYTFWGETITKELNKHIKETKAKFVINLASKEYSKSVHFESLTTPSINIDFKEKKGGSLKIVALFAKQARGAMANYIVQSGASKPKDLEAFTGMGYRFSRSHSSENHLLFTR